MSYSGANNRGGRKVQFTDEKHVIVRERQRRYRAARRRRVLQGEIPVTRCPSCGRVKST